MYQHSISRLSYLFSCGQFISSSQRPSLADVRLNRQADAQPASTSGRTQSQGSSTRGYDRYEYDGRNDDEVHGPNAKWPFNFSFSGKKFPPRVYHTHKVASRSRPGAKKQLGKRKWHPSKRHGRVIRQEDYDAYAADGLGRTTQVLKSESLLDLSVRGGREAKGIIGRIIRASRLWRWPRGRESSESEQVARGTFCRG